MRLENCEMPIESFAPAARIRYLPPAAPAAPPLFSEFRIRLRPFFGIWVETLALLPVNCRRAQCVRHRGDRPTKTEGYSSNSKDRQRQASTRVHTDTHRRTHTHAHTHAHTQHTYTHTYTHTHTHTHWHTNTHVHARTRTHTHTHPHTPTHDRP